MKKNFSRCFTVVAAFWICVGPGSNLCSGQDGQHGVQIPVPEDNAVKTERLVTPPNDIRSFLMHTGTCDGSFFGCNLLPDPEQNNSCAMTALPGCQESCSESSFNVDQTDTNWAVVFWPEKGETLASGSWTECRSIGAHSSTGPLFPPGPIGSPFGEACREFNNSAPSEHEVIGLNDPDLFDDHYYTTNAQITVIIDMITSGTEPFGLNDQIMSGSVNKLDGNILTPVVNVNVRYLLNNMFEVSGSVLHEDEGVFNCDGTPPPSTNFNFVVPGSIGEFVIPDDLDNFDFDNTPAQGTVKRGGFLAVRCDQSGFSNQISGGIAGVDFGSSNVAYDFLVKPGFTVNDEFLAGDINGDGVVNLLDVRPLVELLTSGGYDPAADLDRDCIVSLLDVSLFIQFLSAV